uniref:Uncharacterized protein n=1 Tax=Anguilla anguilla TaxID=7936 RepID=A0A0E9VDP3_ANGAN
MTDNNNNRLQYVSDNAHVNSVNTVTVHKDLELY